MPSPNMLSLPRSRRVFFCAILVLLVIIAVLIRWVVRALKALFRGAESEMVR